jgi:hypothetical protein
MYIKRFAPDIGTNVNCFWKCISNFYYKERLKDYKKKSGVIEPLSLFWSYKVLNLTFLHLRVYYSQFFFFAGISFVCLCEYTTSNENNLVHKLDTEACILTIYVIYA